MPALDTTPKGTCQLGNASMPVIDFVLCFI